DEGYDEARKVWNGLADRHPALVAHCSGAKDVIAAVNFARDNDLLVSVRGGGHSAPGYATCDGGIVIDLSPMKAIEVDPDARTASEDENSELFWGLRGGGGNFGIVTSFTYSLCKVGPLVYGGLMASLPERAGTSCASCASTWPTRPRTSAPRSRSSALRPSRS